jgi:hypothetical protein
MFTRTFALLATLAISCTAARAADEPKSPTADEVKAAKEKLTTYLKGIEGADSARVGELTADGMGAAFPNHVMFSVIFPQYPIARIAPPPLSSANVVAVPKKDGKPVPITDAKVLEKFFKENARAVKTGDEAVTAITAWSRVAAELNQDGFYKFTVKDEGAALKGDTITAIGVAKVDPAGGNKGEVKATLTFKDGKLATAETKANLTAGIRPICQATKLLDPDPIVRAMAEQSIRVMGSAAKPYLDEQRAKATPELKAAINRMWAQIQKEGR